MGAKYDQIGIGYNSTRCADPYLTLQLLQYLSPLSTGKYLDVGCGTGNYTLALQAQTGDYIGLDPSEEMLEQARSKSDRITWLNGSAEAIPLSDASVEGAIATLTLHHWSDLRKGMGEINRVLLPKGRLVIFTSTPEQMEGYWLNHYFPDMLRKSLVQMPDLVSTTEALTANGFLIQATVPYFVRDDLQDLFLYAGKHRPYLYLDPKVQQGISSFAALAHQQEVGEGLNRLKQDIDTGNIEKVMRRYENQLGDYLFIVAERQS